ncbi:hypothetical protein [Actinomadura bangladeshensis]|nr:hypothetical protein [Actinomadura bangladeshensis]
MGPSAGTASRPGRASKGRALSADMQLLMTPMYLENDATPQVVQHVFHC